MGYWIEAESREIRHPEVDRCFPEDPMLSEAISP